jgi:hypothetical protein
VLFSELKFCKNLGFSLSEHCEWGTWTCLGFPSLHVSQLCKDDIRCAYHTKWWLTFFRPWVRCCKPDSSRLIKTSTSTKSHTPKDNIYGWIFSHRGLIIVMAVVKKKLPTIIIFNDSPGLICRDPSSILKFNLAPVCLSKKSRSILYKNCTYHTVGGFAKLFTWNVTNPIHKCYKKILLCSTFGWPV